MTEKKPVSDRDRVLELAQECVIYENIGNEFAKNYAQFILCKSESEEMKERYTLYSEAGRRFYAKQIYLRDEILKLRKKSLERIRDAVHFESEDSDDAKTVSKALTSLEAIYAKASGIEKLHDFGTMHVYHGEWHSVAEIKRVVFGVVCGCEPKSFEQRMEGVCVALHVLKGLGECFEKTQKTSFQTESGLEALRGLERDCCKF
jgi:hypothetical protein